MRKTSLAEMAASSTRGQLSGHPEPLAVEPKSGEHTQSFIGLPGRESNADAFGPQLLTTPTSDSEELLPDIFPDAKFIVPTASKQATINRWFDVWSMKQQTKNEDVQFEGLRESTLYVHGLLEGEIAAVGAQNVVL